MIKRKKTRIVSVGKVKIGAGYPVAIQSMAKTDTRDVDATVRQILSLEKAGCEIIRVAVKDADAAAAIKKIINKINIPLVADMHFDSKLALKAIENGAAKIRINPGNMAKNGELDRVIDAAAEKHIPIRIGVNSGSFSKSIVDPDKIAGEMVKLCLKYIEYFERKKFRDLVVSLKASDVPTTIAAYEKMSAKTDLPLHLGITAAGVPADGIVRSSVGIGALLMKGIGDTIRVSLTGDPVEEVRAGKRILSAVGIRKFGPEVIACPTCGRCGVDLVAIADKLDNKIKDFLAGHDVPVNDTFIVAVMGCEVNGPGEARGADLGIAFGKNRGAIFSRGNIIRTVKASQAVDELFEMIVDNYRKKEKNI
ncbi:MAG TPA: flavodoxin-dependent (E)-4-hydroxy-3-methylbut-2-enyl-diphosphate synthase [Candidatus Omnitrophota bacterium]|nr:flavodoxin-dependent (E)-4-hydroxy-3-methylbut-2-enyl-diphosphate synthase [Candidatus Omnitrophota bacterium]HPS19865.1 flavodoxin-dependent (E)-4-hydroxy-3-methylbut-2-enyl-diphosphate synthase [Candidatus Omnitrophota bacterium]